MEYQWIEYYSIGVCLCVLDNPHMALVKCACVWISKRTLVDFGRAPRGHLLDRLCYPNNFNHFTKSLSRRRCRLLQFVGMGNCQSSIKSATVWYKRATPLELTVRTVIMLVIQTCQINQYVSLSSVLVELFMMKK